MSSTGIVIPCYNAGNVLAEAIQSVRQQSVKPSQVILVDDGSTDPETCKTLARYETSPDITVIRQANAGVSAARNAGISALDTDYVIPLDADDRLRADTVLLVQRVFDSDDSERIGIVAGAVANFGPGQFHGPPPFDGIESMLDGTRIPNTSGFRRADWETVGGYPQELKLGEDWAFWMRILTLGKDVELLEEIFYDYRVSDDSATGSGIDPRDVAKARNFVLADSWPLYAQHPQYVIDELARLRREQASFRSRYGSLIRAKNRILDSGLLRGLRAKTRH